MHPTHQPHQPQPSTRATVQPPARAARGFTLVEVLVVVLIVSILAIIVVPQFTSAAGETRDNALKMNLFRIRQQLEIYKEQHGSTWPSLQNFADQLTLASNVSGETAAPGTAGYLYGPYLRDIPANPYTATNDVGDGEVGTSAWYYNEDTGAFHANDSEEHRQW
ncbi:MAG: prepilin-type N-terminal cleavage/methylation domain-containing protein [Phycisphaeraceae bacterium]